MLYHYCNRAVQEKEKRGGKGRKKKEKMVLGMYNDLPPSFKPQPQDAKERGKRKERKKKKGAHHHFSLSLKRSMSICRRQQTCPEGKKKRGRRRKRREKEKERESTFAATSNSALHLRGQVLGAREKRGGRRGERKKKKKGNFSVAGEGQSFTDHKKEGKKISAPRDARFQYLHTPCRRNEKEEKKEGKRERKGGEEKNPNYPQPNSYPSTIFHYEKVSKKGRREEGGKERKKRRKKSLFVFRIRTNKF